MPCVRLLDGELVNVSGRYVQLSDVRLVFPPHERPPIVVGVTGPKGIDVTARVADGLLLPVGVEPVVRTCRRRASREAVVVRRVRAARGRRPK